MGASAAAGGFIIVIFIAILGFLLFLGLWIYRRRYLRGSREISKVKLFGINLSMVITVFPAVMLLWTIFVTEITDLIAEKRALEELKERYFQVEEDLSFGEIVIPAQSWINLDSPTDYPLESLKDIRQGIDSVRFSTPQAIHHLPTSAFEFNYQGIALELAEAYQYEKDGEIYHCEKGWVLMLNYPEGIDWHTRYREESDQWFNPSTWKIDNCFKMTNGVAVFGVGEYGLYLLSK